MNAIDIRKEEQEPVSVIIFANGDEYESAVEIESHRDGESVSINSSGESRTGRRGEGQYLLIDSKEDALNLIKALEKAIELEWLCN